MATPILNQATLNYNSGSSTRSTASNTATIMMQGPVEVTKHSLETGYHIGESITYHIFIKNASDAPLTDFTVTDDLGTYTLQENGKATPLTYVDPAKYYINDVYAGTLTGTVSDPDRSSVTFLVDSLDVGQTMMITYKTLANEYAPAAVTSSRILNTASVTSADLTFPVTDTNEIPLASYAEVSIQKSMTPEAVTEGSTLTYTFDISNSGTIAATNVILKDTFMPVPTIDKVTIDNVETTDYSFTAATGAFQYPATDSVTAFEIPAALFSQDSKTGRVTSKPSTSRIVVKATL